MGRGVKPACMGVAAVGGGVMNWTADYIAPVLALLFIVLVSPVLVTWAALVYAWKAVAV